MVGRDRQALPCVSGLILTVFNVLLKALKCLHTNRQNYCARIGTFRLSLDFNHRTDIRLIMLERMLYACLRVRRLTAWEGSVSGRTRRRNDDLG